MKVVKDYSFKIFLASILLLNMSVNTYAEIGENENKIVKENQNIYTIKDVYIKWLNDNTTFYVGADILVNAYINGVENDDILWGVRELDGKNSVLNIEPMGSKARLIAASVGRAEVFAQTNDDTYSMRNIVVKVENYPGDSESQAIIASNIIPIQSRIVENGKKLVQVEAKRGLDTAQQKIDAIDKYLKKLAALGTITNESVNSEHEKYEFYIININGLDNIKVELRVDKDDESYSLIKDKLSNINKYNENSNDENFEDNTDGNSNNEYDDSEDNNNENDLEDNTSDNDGEMNNNQDNNNNQGNNSSGNSNQDNNDDEINNSEGKYKVPENEVTQGLEDIIISGGYGDEDDPIIIGTNKDLSLEEQVAIMEEYLKLLMENKDVLVSGIMETKHEIKYKLRIIDRALGQEVKNDFYIEIIINKDNKEEYKTIISMLDGISIKNNNKEQSNSNEESNNIKENTSIEEGFKVDENTKEQEDKATNINKEKKQYETDYNDKVVKEDLKIENDKEKSTSNKDIHPLVFSSAFAVAGVFLIRKVKLTKNI